MYGPEFVSYNFHNLLHLPNDVRKYGDVEQFSAFRFENFIARIKNLIRKGNQPLAQLMRRCIEIELIQEKQCHTQMNGIVPKQCNTQGPLLYNMKAILQFKELQFEKFEIKCSDNKNSCILISNKIVAKAVNFIQCGNGKLYVLAKRMEIEGNFYEQPLPSSTLGIYVVRQIDTDIEVWNVNSITAKLCIFPYKKHYVVLPLLHTFRQDGEVTK